MDFCMPPPSVTDDLVRSLCGTRLGRGAAREVYAYGPNDRLVLKLELGARSFQNAMEWRTWRDLHDTKHAVWLAPCVWISDSGNALLMHRTQPMQEGQEPKKMPAWLSDFKRVNYGLLLGKVVCHDYGSTMLLNHGAFSKTPLQAVEWWG